MKLCDFWFELHKKISLLRANRKMTWKDEIVEEVRKIRDEHAAKFNYDISAICADIRQKQIESGRNVVVNKMKFVKDLVEKPDILRVA